MGGEGLLGIIGGILAVLLGLLITMIIQLKRDFDTREFDIRRRLDAIKTCINALVTKEDYKEDKKVNGKKPMRLQKKC
jgi:hypothetical protein